MSDNLKEVRAYAGDRSVMRALHFFEENKRVEAEVAALKEAINQNNADMMKTGKDELQKTVYEVSSKLYQQAAPQGGQPGANPDPNAPQGNVYDADYKDVDSDNK